jgi:hypothetical protein
MEADMKILPRHLALLFLLVCSPVHAQEVEYGTGLICDTQEQAEHLVAHINGDDVDAAVTAVNADEHDPQACGVATVAFLRGTTLATARNRNATFHVVRILVIGVQTASGFRSIVPAVHVSLFKIKEYAV